jgi:SAM-dependent methyltransferase
VIRALPPVAIEGHEPSVGADASHPMRIVTRRAAGIEGAGWDDATRQQVTAVFDGLAHEWHTRSSPERTAVVQDALARGVGEEAPGVCVEIGSGIGTYSALLAERYGTVMSVDLAEEMLRLAPPGPGHRVRADAARLPVADRVADAVVLVNAFLFPAEVDRVLAPDGHVLWVNSSGEHTPIHLTAAEVEAALPGAWEGTSSRAGVGTWCALRRAGD